MSPDCHPEMDNTDLLPEDGITRFKSIMGILQWVVTGGRIDICYSTASLARFCMSPREGHLKNAEKVLGYLKKYPKRGIFINPAAPTIDDDKLKSQDHKFQDFTHQYHYFKEEIDPRFPEPKVSELELNFFCDSAHDLVTGRSITAILGFAGSTPVVWCSKKQSAVQTSTFGSEFTALKTAVERVITLRYHLRSMGVKVTKPTALFVDNNSVFLQAANPASSLKKIAVALA